jgi:biotin transport system substrate-specific component
MGTSVLTRRAGARLTAVGVVGFAAAVALAAQIAIPLPGTPVPVTLQPMLVVLAGLWLGPTAGLASMLLYLAAGAAGLPAFTPIGAPGVARLLGPTGGYLIAYPAAAFVAGWLARRGAPSLGRNVVAALAGMLVVHAGGLVQLTVLSGSIERAVVLGTLPFAALDLVKAFIAGLLGPKRVDRPSA